MWILKTRQKSIVINWLPITKLHENIPWSPMLSRHSSWLFPVILWSANRKHDCSLIPIRILGMTCLSPLASLTGRKRTNEICFSLAMSPIGDAFRNRLRMFPSLINCCTIDWFQSWPTDALELVANKFLEDVELDDDIRTEWVLAAF